MERYEGKDNAASYSEAAGILDLMTAQDISKTCQVRYSLDGFGIYRVINSEGKMLERDKLEKADELAIHVYEHLIGANPLEEYVSVSQHDEKQFLIKCKKRNLAMLLTLEHQRKSKAN